MISLTCPFTHHTLRVIAQKFLFAKWTNISYTSLYGDIVPIIVARALCKNVILVWNFGCKPECLLIKPTNDQNVRKCIYIVKKCGHYDDIIQNSLNTLNSKSNSHKENDITSLRWQTDGVCSYLNICANLVNSCFMANIHSVMHGHWKLKYTSLKTAW